MSVICIALVQRFSKADYEYDSYWLPRQFLLNPLSTPA